MTDHSDARLVKRLSLFASISAAFSIVVGLSGLAGWEFHVPGLTTWGAAPATMKANTAVCFVLIGLSLWLLRKKDDQSFVWARKLTAKTLATLVGLLGLLSLAEQFFGWDLDIDQFLLVASPEMETVKVRAGLMSPITACVFLLLGIALLLIDWRTRQGWWPAQILSMSAGVLATFGILTLAFDPRIYATHLSLALPTAVTVVVFSVGLVCSRTDWGMGALLCSQNLGGNLARRLLPATFIPVVVGWIRWRVTAAGLYSEWSVVVLASMITMSLLGGLIAWAAVVVDRNDVERRRIEEARERLVAVVDSSDDAIISKTLNGTINAWNRGAEKIFGYQASEVMGKPMLMLFPPDRLNEEANILARIARGESVEHFETVRVRKDGRQIDVSATISPVRDSSGAIVGASKIARDITGRKQAEEALRQSNARRRFALETAKLGEWELDLTTLQAARSLRHDEIFGYQSLLPEWNFDIFLGHVHADDRESVGEYFQTCVSTGKRWEFECRIVCPSGEIRWIWACGDHYRDSSGHASHMFGIVEDITDRKRAEEALRESEERFQAMANGIQQLAWMAGADGSISWYNQRWYEYTGTTLEQMQGWAWQSVHDPAVLPKVLEEWTGAIAAGRPFDMEFPLRGADGRFRMFLTRVMPVKDPGGRVVRWFGTNTDISERKQAEGLLAKQAEELARSRQALENQTLMLQSVLDSISEGLVAADAQGKFVLWNPAAERILGMGAANLPSQKWTEHYGLYMADTVTPFPADQIPLVRAIRGEVSTTEMFVRNPELVQGGWIEVSSGPRRDKHGVVCGGVAAFRDITQRKAAEREIRELNEGLEHKVVERTAQLEAANKELEAFSYSVSHDLRAPLRHIGGFSKMLVEEFGPTLDPTAQHYLDRIQSGTQKMGLLVDELLNLARVGRHVLNRQPTRLNSIVTEVIAILQPESEGREVEWDVGDLPAVECDPVLVKQVFQNLLANALKFTRRRADGKPQAGTPPPPSHTVIQVRHKEEDGQPVFMVRDNGVGFNMKYVDKLFGVFQRLHRAEDFEGTGIGLATVQRIVQKHGGRVWAEGEVGRGAAFYFTLGAGKPVESKRNGATAGGQS